jgi:hypothetical protein
MTTIALWLPLLAVACTGKIEDDSEPTGSDDSDTPTDDSDTPKDDSGNVTEGDRWDGTYVGGWNLTFDKIGSVKVPGSCNGGAVVTVDGKDIGVEVTTAGCKDIGLKFYGAKPKATITDGDIVLDPDFPSNTGTAQFELVGTKETCTFEFEWTFSDIHDPTQVAAEHELRSEEQFEEFYCAGAGYTFDFQAEIPKKDD